MGKIPLPPTPPNQFVPGTIPWMESSLKKESVLRDYRNLGVLSRRYVVSVPGSRPKKVQGLTASSVIFTKKLECYEFDVVAGTDVLARMEMYPTLEHTVVLEKGEGALFRGLAPILTCSGKVTQHVDRTLTQAQSARAIRVWAEEDLTVDDIVLVGRIDPTFFSDDGWRTHLENEPLPMMDP